jgi:hypothetical protein
MHAYASEDPVFVAMNARGQRETGGQLGSFCVNCHAPQPGVRGVGCVACHQVKAVEATHNGGLAWDRTGPMRGGLREPVANAAHDSSYSELVDGSRPTSSRMCGACHDVVLPNGLAIENTFAEWNASLYARPEIGLSCGACHMMGRDAPAAFGGPTRRVHDHAMAGVDVSLVPWPGIEDQRAAITRDLAGVLGTKLCVEPGGGGIEVSVTLDNVQAGHAFPSGTTHARRAWVELTAERDGVRTWEVGAYGPSDVIHAGDDPSAWILGSQFRGPEGGEVQFPWEATAIESELLTAAATADPTDPRFYHARTRSWTIAGAPDTVRLAVRMQPIGLDILDELIAAGELDPAVREAMPIHTLAAAAREWRVASGFGCTP